MRERHPGRVTARWVRILEGYQREYEEEELELEGYGEGQLQAMGADDSVKGSSNIIRSDMGSDVSSSANITTGSNMMATPKGVMYDGQPFGCAPLHPAM
jgi:hypothetical protein